MPSRHMTLEMIRIERLRAFADATIDVRDYTAFVGANGAGKSTILFALNVFFRNIRGTATDPTNLSLEDFHNQDTEHPIRVTLTFGSLSEKAKEVLKHYVRQGKFIVTAKAEWDSTRNRAAVTHSGTRLVMPEFAPYFEAKEARTLVEALRPIYQGIMELVPELPTATTGTAMEAALRQYEEAHPERCVPIESRAEIFGVSRGADRIEDLLQWIYVPAVMDAGDEAEESKNSALGDLLARTVRGSLDLSGKLEEIRNIARTSYQELMTENDGALADLSARLTDRLKRLAHPATALSLNWSQQPEKAVSVAEPFAKAKVSEFEKNAHELSRCGHGLQRAYLLALLQELSRHDDEEGPTLILGIEEPELYQHPPQAKHLAVILRELAQQNAQVLVTTHSSYFVSAVDFEGIRAVRRHGERKEARVKGTTYSAVSARLAAANGQPAIKPEGLRARLLPEFSSPLGEAFFAPCFVLVEGLEDEAYLKGHAVLNGHWDEMRRLGVSIVCANGKGHMMRMLAIAQELQIPVFVVFDSDGDEVRPGPRREHELDNGVLLQLCGQADPDIFPATDALQTSHAIWATRLSDTVMGEFAQDQREDSMNAARLATGHIKSAEKNPLFIAEFLRHAYENQCTSATLERLCENVLEFARCAAMAQTTPEDGA